MHVTTVISAGITVLGALVVLVWMPGRRSVTAEAAEAISAAENIAAEPAGIES
jgi:hypothetical protein